MSTVKHFLFGAVLVAAGVLLRVHGGDTDVGPINLRMVGNVLWIVGALDVLTAVGSLVTPNRTPR